MTKKLSVIGNYGDLYYSTKIHNRALIEQGLQESAKKRIKDKREAAADRAKKKLSSLRKKKIELLKEYRDLLNKPTKNVVIQPQVVEQQVLTVEETLHRKLLENRERYKNEIRIHGEQTLLKEGFVYLIENSSFSGWVKVGMAFDYEKRLDVYNQYDPEKRYAIKGLRWSPDRRLAESHLIEEMSKHAIKQNGEWFKIDIDVSLNIFYSLE